MKSMTNHYQKIQSLGNKMASNLETMGVSASFNDGGLTLADKILQIQHFTDGITVYADKTIFQSGDTCNLYALVLKDGVPQSSKKVHFLGINNSTINLNSSSQDVDIGENGWVVTLTGGSVEIGDLYNWIGITKTSTGYCIGKNQECSNNTNLLGDYVFFDGSTLTLYSDVDSLDISSFSNINSVDFTNLSGVSSTMGSFAGKIDIPAYAITGANGVATVSYSGKHSGLLYIRAFCGTVVSEPYTVLDAQFRDGGKYGDKNPNWTPSNITAKCDEGDTYTTLSNSSSNNGDYTISATVDYTTPFVIEFDNHLTSNNKDYIFLLGSSSTFFTLSSRSITGNCHVKLIVDENVRVFVDGVEKNSVTLASAPTGFRFRVQSGGANIGYSNFVIYSI